MRAYLVDPAIRTVSSVDSDGLAGIRIALNCDRLAGIRVGANMLWLDAAAQGEGNRTDLFWIGQHRTPIVARALVTGAVVGDPPAIELSALRFLVTFPGDHSDA